MLKKATKHEISFSSIRKMFARVFPLSVVQNSVSVLLIICGRITFQLLYARVNSASLLHSKLLFNDSSRAQDRRICKTFSILAFFNNINSLRVSNPPIT
jgi:hypothetical protein